MNEPTGSCGRLCVLLATLGELPPGELPERSFVFRVPQALRKLLGGTRGLFLAVAFPLRQPEFSPIVKGRGS